MNILALESSSPRLSLAVKKEAGPVFQETLDGAASHVENLMPILVRLLEKAELPIHEVDTCLMGRGPGSFTGLRVGFATLKALQFIQKRNCYGALSLDMMAEAVELPEGSKMIVLVDAYRSKIYHRSYMRKQNLWHPVTEPTISPAETCSALFDSSTYVIGNARARYFHPATGIASLPLVARNDSTVGSPVGDASLRAEGEAISKTDLNSSKNILKNPHPSFQILPDSFDYPHAASLIQMWDRRASALQKLEKPEDFIPLYFRLSEAEERKYHDTPA